MKTEATRDVSETMMKKCKDEKVFKPFVDFVRQSRDLELCFRGNDSDTGTITIYRHNRVIWQLKCEKDPTVSISTNQCRFMPDWDKYAIKGLWELGFRPVIEGYKKLSYEEIERLGLLAKKTGKEDKPNYDVIDLQYVIKNDISTDNLRDVVKKSYIILCRMQNEYFEPLGMNSIGNSSKVKDYVKAYCLNINLDNVIDEKEINKASSKLQSSVEKHVQQELFALNNKFKNGLFMYDLEFSQPEKNKKKIKNTPDMFAIRYDKKGEMKSICLVEVKSTKGAFEGRSGVAEHLKGMLKYALDKDLMYDRKCEAYNILNQYKELKLRGVPDSFDIVKKDEIKKLPVEIIFVFSHGFTWDHEVKINKEKKDTVKNVIKFTIEEYKKIYDSLKEVEVEEYFNIEFGAVSQNVSAYSIKLYDKIQQ